MNDIGGLLRIKIEKAKAGLPPDTLNAIATVDWKDTILSLRAKRGYTFEQLGNLELETELVLCGLLNPANYPREIAKRMQISEKEANELVNEMNDLVFKKIRQELIKSTERKKIFASRTPIIQPEQLSGKSVGEKIPIKIAPDHGEKATRDILSNAGIEIIEKNAEGLPIKKVTPLINQKLSSSFQIPTKETDHSVGNLSKPVYQKDPYRLSPEE